MHQAFYRKYRPKVFSDVVGRDTITTVLRGQVKSGKVSHAYLFCGMRGSGKTTCAKILAKAVNCLSPENGDPCGKCEACRAIDSGLTLDIVEMDAASNNGVGDVRDMIEQITYTPSELKMRVYIIDEVHMLSTAAFNALLKTLEEPPAHAMFILATTEVHKLPATIVSRCQRYDFDRIEMSDIVKRLRYVADCENVQCDEDALYVMAKLSGGALRDALGYLELCAASGRKLDEESVSALLGTGNYDLLVSIVEAIADKDMKNVFRLLDKAYKNTNDIGVLWFDLVSVYRDLLIIKSTGGSEYTDATPSQAARLSVMTAKFTKEKLAYNIRTCEEAIYSMQRSPSQKRVIADMAAVRMCDAKLDGSADALASRISELEDKLALLGTGAAIQMPEPQIKPEEKTETVAVKVETEDKDPGKKAPTMTLSRKYADVISKMRAKDPACGSYISSSVAYECDDGTYRILFDNDFALHIANQNKDKIDSAVISTLGKYTPQTVILAAAETKKDYILIDDVFDALNE